MVKFIFSLKNELLLTSIFKFQLKRRNNFFVAFLPCCIPNLKFNNVLLNGYSFAVKFKPIVA